MWVPATELAKAPGHPFYQRLNRVLGKHGFDDFVEAERNVSITLRHFGE